MSSKTGRVNVRLSPRVDAWLKQEAKSYETTVSEVARRILLRACDEAGAERSHLAMVAEPKARYITERVDSPSARHHARRDGGLKEG